MRNGGKNYSSAPGTPSRRKNGIPGPPYYTVLRLRVEKPDVPVAELAEQLRQDTGQPMTPANFRKILQRARHRLAELLVAEVAHSLTDPTPERLQEELQDLGLLKHCASVFHKDKK